MWFITVIIDRWRTSQVEREQQEPEGWDVRGDPVAWAPPAACVSVTHAAAGSACLNPSIPSRCDIFLFFICHFLFSVKQFVSTFFDRQIPLLPKLYIIHFKFNNFTPVIIFILNFKILLKSTHTYL